MKMRRVVLSAFCVGLTMAGFQNCSPAHVAMNSNSSSSLSAAEIADFSATLQPVLTTNCGACHGVSQQPMFAVSDPAAAVATIHQYGLVNMTAPAQSMFVQKIMGGHNGFTSSLATTVQNGIQSWANMMAGTGGGSLSVADTEAPSVMIGSPSAGTTLSGTVNVGAVAIDNVGVVGVQFVLDGVDLGAEVTTAPYQISMNTLSQANGAHTLSARARDAAGNVGVAADVNVNVSNSHSDTVAPTASITSPLALTNLSGSVTVSVTASDNVGVTSVQLKVDGTAVGSPVTSAPYSVVLDASTLSAGVHVLTATASDAAGNVGTSAPVSVNVIGTTPSNPNAKFSWISANILVPKCVRCHGPSLAQRGYRYDTYSFTLSSALSKNLSGSKLYTTTNSGSMPQGSARLTTTQMQAISDWIMAGTPNN